MSLLEQLPQGINMNQLPELVKANPRHTRLLTGLREIDAFIKKVVEDTISNMADISTYYIKTELNQAMYNLMLYNSERQAIVAYSWMLDTLLAECQAKVVQPDVETITKRMIQEFGKSDLQTGDKINWLH